MKKLIAFLMAPLTAGILITGCGNNDTATSTGANTATQAPATQSAPPAAKIVVGLDDNFPPMGFRDEQSLLVGFDIDLAREVAKRMGNPVEFKPIDWSSKEAELGSKRVDALWNGLTITEERKKNISFTAPYMENHQIIIVKSDSPIKVKTDLAGKTIGIQEGSSAVDAVEREVDIAQSLKAMKKYADNVTALMDLITGRIDALVVDEVVGRYYTSKKPDDYTILEENFGTEEYGVGVRKDDTELLGKLQKAMDDMKQDGTAAQISTKWFGKDIIK